MTSDKRHIGRIKETDRRCVVVYMQIPGKEDNALIVDTDALPPRYHDALMDVVEGEGQHEVVLADVLSRRLMPTSGQDILNTLHNEGLLRVIPVTSVNMYPRPNMAIPLENILIATGKISPRTNNDNIEILDNRYIENQRVEETNGKRNIAKSLLAQAEIMMLDAKRKMEEAYEIDPSLKPKNVAPPTVSLAENPVHENTIPPVTQAKRGRKPSATTVVKQKRTYNRKS